MMQITNAHQQGLEEMRHLLMRATLELDSARAVAEAEAEAHEVQVRHLQELLAATQRERDEAREQLLGLQGHLSRSSSMSGRHGSVARTDSLPNSGLSSGMFQSVAGEAEQEQQHQQQLDMEKLQQHLELLPDEHLAHLDDTMDTVSPVVSSLQGIPTHVLPEPPGADLHAMLSTLPEKGKLMQAVMDAGPLLQTLMMASSPSLPQWRHPPPALETLDLPCLSVMPDYFQKSEYLEGNGGPGTLRLITMGPAVGHAKQVKERMDVIDEENKTLKYTMVDGDPRYSSFGGMMKFTSGAEQGTSDAYWEVQYEPVGDMGPPEHVKGMVIKVFKALEGAINADPQSFA
ncbi:unnamed protein product [Sphagnum jensenii]|uniref:Bet v I/Major latex protein domain-containing protein n=1 Tax=Sphagnum jensenii TaxID=128206 RepID=A0ABP0X878_9BRYO